MRVILLFVWFVLPGQAGEIALSFDDAPRPNTTYLSGRQRTTLLIENLRNAGIDQVVFFATTAYLEKPGSLERLNQYAQAGHLIGNHTHSHQQFQEIGLEGYIQDIYRADNLLKHISGFVPWFRYPYLKRAPTEKGQLKVQAALNQLGYLDGYVTIDTFDWCMDSIFQEALREGHAVNMDHLKQAYVTVLWESIMFYDQLAIKALGRSPKHVILLHENDLAALFIGDLVTKIQEEGWFVISPEEAYADPLAVLGSEGLCHQSLIDSFAKETGVRGPTHSPFESGTYLEKYFEDQAVFTAPSLPRTPPKSKLSP